MRMYSVTPSVGFWRTWISVSGLTPSSVNIRKNGALQSDPFPRFARESIFLNPFNPRAPLRVARGYVLSPTPGLRDEVE